MDSLRTSDFNYCLPEELIAQTPIEPRDSSRLLVLDTQTGAIQHRRFHEIGEYLGPADLLVFNDSRVIPARLLGTKAGTGGRVEILLLHRMGPGLWQALVRPGKRVAPGAVVNLTPSLLRQAQDRLFPQREGKKTETSYNTHVLDRLEGGTRLVRLEDESAIEACGTTPLPPYIHAPLADVERYQTVYARVSGSAAAPTAGLHFTKELLASLAECTAGFAFVTLHVGLDTFRPVAEEDPRHHQIHREFAILPEETAARIRAARAAGGRIISIGTTTARVLETAASTDAVEAYAGWTDLFILPGHRFRAFDALVTNFHLPRSSLLMLVSAFAGKGLVDRAYAEAIRERYRFYSFGDAMLIV